MELRGSQLSAWHAVRLTLLRRANLSDQPTPRNRQFSPSGWEPAVPKLNLKEILSGGSSGRNAALAAFIRANTHHARREYGRAVQYARIALRKSRELGLENLSTSCLTLLGRLELVQSHFEAAAALFQESLQHLEAQGDGRSRLAAFFSDNVGYCHIALDRLSVGLPFVYYPEILDLKSYLRQISLMSVLNLRA